MDKYVIWADGEKVVNEDLNAVAVTAGKAADSALGADRRIFVEQTNAKGYVEPWVDGPIVTPNGATGTLNVAPFRAFKSATGASSGGGTDNADESSATHEQVVSAYYAGGTVTVPTPPTVASGNARWDLLYAIVVETDSDAAARLVVPPGGTGGVQTIYTRHKAVVSLAWVQGTAIAEGATPATGEVPTLPTPASGTAHIPIAYVRANKTNTPSTVTYSVDQIANCPRLARPKHGTRLNASSVGSKSSGGAVGIQQDARTLIITAPAAGGWGNSPSDYRPSGYVEQLHGGGVVFPLLIGPFKASVTATFGAGWTVLDKPIATPDTSSALYDLGPIDWRGRLFFAHLSWILTYPTNSYAWDTSVVAGSRYHPTPVASGAAATEKWCMGNSVAEQATWLASASLAGYRLAALFHDVGAAGANDDIAILVSSSTGALHLAAREASAGKINAGIGVLRLEYSGKLAVTF